LKEEEIMGAVESVKSTSVKCRALSEEFIKQLSAGGRYHQLVELVHKNKDLHLEFKGNLDLANNKGCIPKDEAIIILYKGNRVLTLHREGEVEVTPVFVEGLKGKGLPASLYTETDLIKFIEFVPHILFNIASRGKTSIEIEYEQQIIRSNNFEHKLFPEYLIIYNQYKPAGDRWDLLAIKWEQRTRQSRTITGKLALIEVKYGLNPDIKNGTSQIERYFNYLSKNMDAVCDEMELILRQKLKLNLIDRSDEQKRKLQEMKLDRQPKSAEVIFYLIDYNPNSDLRDKMIKEAKKLYFHKQIRIAEGGLCMWDQRSKPLDKIEVRK
jgi:hypothetical protein